MNKRLTRTRLILAIISTGLEEVAVWAIWTRVLPDFGIAWPRQILVIVMIAWAAFGTWLFTFTTNVLKKQSQVGLTSMVGSSGIAAGVLDPAGMVKIKGELWRAVSAGGRIEAGEDIEVVNQNGLELSVRKADGAIR